MHLCEHLEFSAAPFDDGSSGNVFGVICFFGQHILRLRHMGVVDGGSFQGLETSLGLQWQRLERMKAGLRSWNRC